MEHEHIDIAAAQPTVTEDDLLTEWHREVLSPNAQKLFVAIWKTMHWKRQTEIWMDDAEASRRARILIQYISAARTELINLGIVDCYEGYRQWRYTYVEQPSQEEETEP